MVAAVRGGASQRSVARQFHVSLWMVQYWVRRAGRQRLDRVDWADHSRRPHRTQRTARAIENRVLAVRRRLKHDSVLGECGAAAIAQELTAEGAAALSIRTIGRILARRGAVDRHARVRRPPPPPGWYLPPVARREAELDSFDVIEGLKIWLGPCVDVLTGVSLHGGVVGAWPKAWIGARTVVPLLLSHWQDVGLPHYAQFDNATIFQGPHQHRDAISRVMRCCLSLGIVPVFTPPRETGFQAAIESFNARWQAKVWARFQHANLRGLQHRSARYVRAHRARAAMRIDSAPRRRAIASHWEFDPQQRPQGMLVFVRRTTAAGAISLLGHTFPVDRHWRHRLVRADVDLSREEIRLHALRRREPTDQPLLRRVSYTLPVRPFKE
jgi:transposase